MHPAGLLDVATALAQLLKNKSISTQKSNFSEHFCNQTAAFELSIGREARF